MKKRLPYLMVNSRRFEIEFEDESGFLRQPIPFHENKIAAFREKKELQVCIDKQKGVKIFAVRDYFPNQNDVVNIREDKETYFLDERDTTLIVQKNNQEFSVVLVDFDEDIINLEFFSIASDVKIAIHEPFHRLVKTAINMLREPVAVNKLSIPNVNGTGGKNGTNLE